MFPIDLRSLAEQKTQELLLPLLNGIVLLVAFGLSEPQIATAFFTTAAYPLYAKVTLTLVVAYFAGLLVAHFVALAYLVVGFVVVVITAKRARLDPSKDFLWRALVMKYVATPIAPTQLANAELLAIQIKARIDAKIGPPSPTQQELAAQNEVVMSDLRWNQLYQALNVHFGITGNVPAAQLSAMVMIQSVSLTLFLLAFFPVLAGWKALFVSLGAIVNLLWLSLTASLFWSSQLTLRLSNLQNARFVGGILQAYENAAKTAAAK